MLPVRAVIVTLTCLMLSPLAWAQAPVTGTATPGPGRGGQARPAAPVRDRQPGAPAVPQGTGSIAGRVLSGDGLPLRRTQVQLAGVGGRVAQTDSEGRFAFTGLPAGRYTLRANRQGYVALAYGMRTPADRSQPIDLADGQALTGLDIVLPRGSVITGRVTDEFGEPVLQAQVQVLRFQYQPDGERRLNQAGNQATTDDLGQFRIWGLAPGDYVISATARQQFINVPVTNTVISGGVVTSLVGGIVQDRPQEEGYAPTFYPGTTNPAEAQALTVGIGQEVTASLQLVATRLARVSGMVFDSQGRALARTQVMLRTAGNLNAGFNRGGQSNEEGAFSLDNVPPGDYLLEVRPRPQLPQNANINPANLPGGPDNEFASVPLSVGGDLTGIRVVTGKPATITGRVTYDGMPPANGMRIRVVTQPADPTRSIVLPPANRNGNANEGVVAADGTFELTRLTGPVFVRVQLENTGGPQPAQVTYMTKSVIVDGVDVADVPFDPTRRGGTTNMTVVLTDKVTEVSGTVTDSRGNTVDTGVALIVPEDLPPGVSPQRFVRTLQVDRQGHFTVRGMPPGRYAVVAATATDNGRQYDPAQMARVRQFGRSFTIREGDKVSLELKITTDF